jgi:hypothetical protein
MKLARRDAQVRRFMTVPGVGSITALAFKATIDEPPASPYAIRGVHPTVERTMGPARMSATAASKLTDICDFVGSRTGRLTDLFSLQDSFDVARVAQSVATPSSGAVG